MSLVPPAASLGMTEQKPSPTTPVDKDWWRGAVIYQIYPRSFQDHNGDGVGDLVGITERLDYVADLGVDAIWLSPFFTSPMKDFGYDVSNYRDVDPIFGTLGDFDRLIEKAHALGLKVIIDQVISHSLRQAPVVPGIALSRTNERHDWYVWADPKPDGTPPNNWLSIFGGSAWTWDSRRMQYYMHNFLASQPDLNFHNPAVQDAVLVRHALLARARRRRLPARYRELLLPLARARVEPGGEAGGFQRLHRAGREPLQFPGTPLRQEPARKPRVPEAPARADGRVSGPHHRRRDRRQPAPARSHGAVHLGHRQAAHGLHLRLSRRRVRCRPFPQGDRPDREGCAGRLDLPRLLQPRRGAPCQPLGRPTPTGRLRAARRPPCCSPCAARSASTRARNWA